MGQNLLQELHAQIAFYANAVYEVNIEVNSQTHEDLRLDGQLD